MNDIVTKQKLVDDLKVVLKDAEILLRETASQIGDKASEARTRLERGIQKTREQLAELEADMKEQINAAAEAADDYVRENPWQSAGIAAGIGFILGVILSRSIR